MTGKINIKARKFYVSLGENIRLLRIAKNKSQTEIAELLGVTFQQIQKYEDGVNRISVDKLIEIAAFLNVGLDDLCGARENLIKNPDTVLLLEDLSDKEFASFLRAWKSIKNSHLRAGLVSFLKMAAS